jgi:glyoxylase-like metal-dependent hydrolase (beta-lactamase superfamily II)
MKELKLYLNYAGLCYARKKYALLGGENKDIQFHALFGLIQHPEQGWILFDTGYTQRFYEATKNFPNKIYALATKVAVHKDEEVKAQLEKFGLTPSDIRHVIISHFHADHIGGLKDFPNARLYCSRPAYRQLKRIGSTFAFRKGILKDLLPEDFDDRIVIIEDSCIAVKDRVFDIKYDLFGDDSLLLYPVPGHAAGMIAILLKTRQKKYFLIADACWLKESYQRLVLPHPFVKLFFDSWKDFKNSLERVHRFHKQNPDVLVVPTHCFETTKHLVTTNDLNAL